MKILVLGDIHGYTSTLDIPTVDIAVDIVDQTDADAVLQVGDMGGGRSFSKPVYWIFGNNDILSLVKPEDPDNGVVKNLCNIKTGEVVTLSTGPDSLRIAGLNGAYDPLYFEYDRERLDDPGYFTKGDIEKCLDMKNIDIFLVHGCPSGLGFGREPDHGVPSIRKILDSVRPRYMFCGHGHFFKQVMHDECTICSLDLVSRAYYTLDTGTGEFTPHRTDPARFPIIKEMIKKRGPVIGYRWDRETGTTLKIEN
jgi:Icc-related predicted phosphoesterase